MRFGGIVDTGGRISLVRAIYMPDKPNQTIYVGW